MDPRPLLLLALPEPVEFAGADIAWVLVATALVLLMTPGLAFFYGGLVRAKNALNTMMMSLGALAARSASPGRRSATASPSTARGRSTGGFGHAMLAGVGLEAHGDAAAPALHGLPGHLRRSSPSRSSPGRWSSACASAPGSPSSALWTLLVYAPVCHWVWGGGWLAELGALDFAGGTVVHVNAGAAALVAALVLGPRKDYGRQALLPHNVPFVLLGTGLLWFGWFGFNAGSALGANTGAVLAFANTLLAPARDARGLDGARRQRTGRVTAVGAATAIVVGLVAVTPAAGFVAPRGALAIGALAALPSYFASAAPGAHASRRLARRGRRARPRRHSPARC